MTIATAPMQPAAAVDLDRAIESFLLHQAGSKGLASATVESYRHELQVFQTFLQEDGSSIEDAGHPLFRRYTAWLSGTRGYAPASVNRRLAIVRLLIKDMRARGTARFPLPTRDLAMKVPEPLPKVLSKAEAEELIDEPDTLAPLGLRDRAIIDLLYSAGLRVAELASADVTDLDFERFQLRVTGKGRKVRDVLFAQATAQSLAAWIHDERPHLASDQEPALFVNRYGRRMSHRAVQKLVRKHAENAGIDGHVHPHVLRHSFATHLLANGAGIRTVQQLLGHSQVTTTTRYVHVANPELKAAYSEAFQDAPAPVSGRNSPPPAPVNLHGHVDDFLELLEDNGTCPATVSQHRLALDRFTRYLGLTGRSLADVDGLQFYHEYGVWLHDQGGTNGKPLASATVTQQVAPLRHFLQYLRDLAIFRPTLPPRNLARLTRPEET